MTECERLNRQRKALVKRIVDISMRIDSKLAGPAHKLLDLQQFAAEAEVQKLFKEVHDYMDALVEDEEVSDAN